uniref:endolytic transglycosylase MltG n=1 Tax=Aquiluna sp. TaxID=2053504 RepID=UPI004048752E
DGAGGPPVQITIEPGDTGSDVARKLVEADVIKSFEAIYRDMIAADPTFYPGVYEYPTQIPAARALQILLSNTNKVVIQTTIPEGWTVAEILPRLAADLGLELGDLEAAVEAATERLPEQAPSIEGFLFPATYTFNPGVDADTVINTMLDRMEAELDDYDLTLKESLPLLTLASIVQLEGLIQEDFFKISRVFANRLDRNIALQSDPTVKYYFEGSIDSFQEGMADTENPYNTYYNPGLPPGPIASPGGLAIEATVRPAEGDWLYFVSINLITGETVFSESLAEHERAAELYRQWLRDNPDYD